MLDRVLEGYIEEGKHCRSRSRTGLLRGLRSPRDPMLVTPTKYKPKAGPPVPRHGRPSARGLLVPIALSRGERLTWPIPTSGRGPSVTSTPRPTRGRARGSPGPEEGRAPSISAGSIPAGSSIWTRTSNRRHRELERKTTLRASPRSVRTYGTKKRAEARSPRAHDLDRIVGGSMPDPD